MKFKDFEIRPATWIDGHIDPFYYSVVKWVYNDKSYEAINVKTREKEVHDKHCYVIADLIYNKKDNNWTLKSVGTRFLEDYEEGLNEYILKWLDLWNVCRKEENEDNLY